MDNIIKEKELLERELEGFKKEATEKIVKLEQTIGEKDKELVMKIAEVCYFKKIFIPLNKGHSISQGIN